MRRFVSLLVLLLVLFTLVAPTVALAADVGAQPEVALAAFVLPYAILVPVVVAIVNRAKESFPLPTWGLWLVGIAVSVTCVYVLGYFAVMPLWAQYLVAGTAVFLAAAGVFDLFKLFATFTSTAEGE